MDLTDRQRLLEELHPGLSDQAENVWQAWVWDQCVPNKVLNQTQQQALNAYLSNISAIKETLQVRICRRVILALWAKEHEANNMTIQVAHAC